jgi:hypothetical protein
MRVAKLNITLLALLLHSAYCYGQQANNANNADSIAAVPSITKIPLKFITQTNDKIDKYTNRITSKTEKTLTKLAKWENKIHKLLDKASPQTAQQLFGEGKLTFASMLQKVQEGKSLAENSRAHYTEYNDKLVTNIKYIETQKADLSNKYLKPLAKAKEKASQLEKEVAETETAEKLIKERKKELLTEAYKVLGKNKYISKMQQECFYYTETLKNYKEIFNDPTKAEAKAMELLGQIPAVNSFVQQNSMLASLFGNPSFGQSPPSEGGGALAGLQTRASISSLISDRIAAGGPNAAAQISANIQAAQGELTKLKDKILKAGSSSTVEEDGLPSFKKKDLKSKTFAQRIEIGSNIQFGKPNAFVPSQADLGLSIGYKISEKSTAGLGCSYKLNYGAINDFYLQHGGISLRSFLDMKLKKQFYVTGGFEMNYNNAFHNFSEVSTGFGRMGIGNAWQSSGLVGIMKKISFPTSSFGKKAGLVKGTKLSLLYDFLYNSHLIETPAFLFRVGYNF